MDPYHSARELKYKFITERLVSICETDLYDIQETLYSAAVFNSSNSKVYYSIYIVPFLEAFLHFPLNIMFKQTHVMKTASFENRKFRSKGQHQPNNSTKKPFW